ncbi:MAG: LPS O-antigen subunit length determinant protein (WzzB/FepE family) [Sulfurimonas sp.]|jgi:LPS O-antigen subunit length determinant protein (WzzB/FepE family)
MQNTQRYEEDEIDLRELFRTLMRNKIKIVVMTSIITIGAIIYAYSAPKVYESKVILKIGEYKLKSNSNSKVVVADSLELSKELEILFIDILKNEKDRKSKIKSIGLVKKQKSFLEISALGSSNEFAVGELEKVVSFVQTKHKKILDEVKENREAEVKQITANLHLLSTKTLKSLIGKIQRYKKDIQRYEVNLEETQKNLKKIKVISPTLAAIQINERRYIVENLKSLKDSLEGFEKEKDNIELFKIQALKEKLIKLEVLMRPYNYKNTEVVGNIMTNDYAIKPKKKLIVIVAFVTGLILSIFIVFFMEFIKGFKEEEKEEKSE